MALAKRDAQQMIVRVYDLLSRGLEDIDIMDELGLSAEDYRDVKVAMFDAKAEELRRKPNEHVFIDYMIQQEANIKALSSMIKEFRQSNQHNALVGAVRARSEILDKIMTMGQSIGLIAKEPDKHQVVGGENLAQLTNQQLKGEITELVGELNGLVQEFGDKSFNEIVVKEIHHGPEGVEKKEEE